MSQKFQNQMKLEESKETASSSSHQHEYIIEGVELLYFVRG